MSSNFKYFGVNISGGEFGSNVPGTLGSDYTYPTQAEINYWAGQGMDVIRLPFLFERLFASPGQFSQADLTAIQNVISWAKAAGITVDLDPHQYGSLSGSAINPGTTAEQNFDKDWAALAGAVKGDSNVLFGLENEPNTQTPTQQAQVDNDAIAAIRGAGATTQQILVPGTDWTGAWSWVSSGNSAAINPSTIKDPNNNWAVEVHQYLDSDGSGTNYGPITNAQIGVQRLQAVTQWAQQNNVKLFLGEFGVPSDSQSETALNNMLSYMNQNAATSTKGGWEGGTYWSSGAWWGSYPFSVEPNNGQNAPQTAVLDQYAPGAGVPSSPPPSPPPPASPPPSPPPPASPPPTGASPNDTTITPGVGSINDGNGDTFTITASGTVDMNGSALGYTNGVIEGAWVNGNFWQENNQNLWWEYTGNASAPWTGTGTSTSPLPASPPPSPPPPVSPPPPPPVSPPPPPSGTIVAPQTQWHYAPNSNFANGAFNASGDPGSIGFNLADVSDQATADSLPNGSEGLLWLGGDTVAQAESIVAATANDPKVFGYYVADEPTTSAAVATAKTIDDYIAANGGGKPSFIVAENTSTTANTANYSLTTPQTTDATLVGIDPYPVLSSAYGGVNFGTIATDVSGAEAAGWTASQIVPVYQAFSGPDSTGASEWVMPTAQQEETILQDWSSLVPNPKFDYAYSWGAQGSSAGNTAALANTPSLQAVFQQLFSQSGEQPTGGSPPPPPPPVSPPPPPPVSPPPPPPAYTPITNGTGPDSVVLQVSEDAWANGDGTSDQAGDAIFTVSINGVQQGGAFIALAPHSSGADESFTFNGTFGVNPTLTVNFLNDAYGGSPTTDRNLYVDNIKYDGQSEATALAAGTGSGGSGGNIMSTGSVTYDLTGGNTSPPPPPPVSPPPPTVSPNDTVITPGSGSILDGKGDTFTITNSGTVNMNGSALGYTNGVIEGAWVNGNFWQENNNHLWWEYSGNPSAPWSGTGTSTSPLPASPPPSPPPPVSPPPPTNGILWGSGGHEDQGGPYTAVSLQQQASDLHNVFGSGTVLYRDFGDGLSPSQEVQDVATMQGQGVQPIVVVDTYPPWGNFGSTTAYQWGFQNAQAMAQGSSAQYFEIGNEWSGDPTNFPHSGNGLAPSGWTSGPNFQAAVDVTAGAIAAIRQYAPNAKIIGGAANGWVDEGFQVAVANALQSQYPGKMWDYTSLHWYSNMGDNPANFNGGENAIAALKPIGKPIAITEFGANDGGNGGSDLTAMMQNFQANAAVSSTSPGIALATQYELYPNGGWQDSLYNVNGSSTSLSSDGQAVKTELGDPVVNGVHYMTFIGGSTPESQVVLDASKPSAIVVPSNASPTEYDIGANSGNIAISDFRSGIDSVALQQGLTVTSQAFGSQGDAFTLSNHAHVAISFQH